MPGNIANAAPSGVMPFALCTQFRAMREYAQLQSAYHDGTIQRSQLAQTSRRTYAFAMRLAGTTMNSRDAATLAAIYNFYTGQNGGLTPFLFYDPFDVASGQEPGSNYDPTGNNTQGRVTVVFRGNWAQVTDVCRTNVGGLDLVEVE
jgi:hypothetical protein